MTAHASAMVVSLRIYYARVKENLNAADLKEAARL